VFCLAVAFDAQNVALVTNAFSQVLQSVAGCRKALQGVADSCTVSHCFAVFFDGNSGLGTNAFAWLLQGVVGCCRVLQGVVGCFKVWPRCCSVLQDFALIFIVLWWLLTDKIWHLLRRPSPRCCNLLQAVARCCRVLQNIAMCCCRR